MPVTKLLTNLQPLTPAVMQPDALSAVSLEQYPLARCNDGSAAQLYWRGATSAGSSHLWIVHLAMGGWCHDGPSCAARRAYSPALTSSISWPSTVRLDGLMNARDPMLRAANKVHVPYCTSDAHMGNASAFGMQFRGHEVVRSVLHHLVTVEGLGRAPGHTLLFGGSSAGARGAMVHLDYVSAMLSEALGSAGDARVRVLGFLDSPLWLDVEPMRDVETPSRAATTRAVYSFARVAHLGPRCRAAYAASGDEWKCMFGQYRLRFISTPMIVVASLYDAYLLTKNTRQIPPETPGALGYAAAMANLTAQVVGELDRRRVTVSSPACYGHARALDAEAFNRAYVNGSASNTLDRGTADLLAGVHHFWIDRCDGFGCGSGCEYRLPPEPPPSPPSASAAKLTSPATTMVGVMGYAAGLGAVLTTWAVVTLVVGGGRCAAGPL